jgi:hypothetical protein
LGDTNASGAGDHVRRMRIATLIGITLALALGAAACGGSDDADAHYSLASVQRCLSAERLSSWASTFFQTSQGAISYETSGGEVVLAFGRDHDEAKGVAQSLAGVGTVLGDKDAASDVAEIVQITGNVAYWSAGEDEISESAEARISDCLDGAR